MQHARTVAVVRSHCVARVPRANMIRPLTHRHQHTHSLSCACARARTTYGSTRLMAPRRPSPEPMSQTLQQLACSAASTAQYPIDGGQESRPAGSCSTVANEGPIGLLSIGCSAAAPAKHLYILLMGGKNQPPADTCPTSGLPLHQHITVTSDLLIKARIKARRLLLAHGPILAVCLHPP